MLSNLNKPRSSQHWVADIISMIIFFGIFYALWIGSHPLITPDEGRYSEVAREMVVSGDYVTPRLNGVAFLDKPALYYWLQAFSIKMFGLKEWSLRFWPAFLGILGALVTYLSARVLYDRRVGLLSAIIVATSPLYYGGSHFANLDLEVASLVSCALLTFIAAMKVSSSRYKNILLISAYIFAGLAALTKGLIGIAFPAMIIGAWIMVLNRWKVLLQMRLFTGLSLFLLITAPWYFMVQKANPEFLHFFFVTQQVSRFLTTQAFNSKAAVWFYIPIILMGIFPWSIFLIQSLVEKFKLVWQDRQRHATELFLLIWFVVILVFFSIPKSKTVGYILPIFPVSAVLIGSYLGRFWDDVNIVRRSALLFAWVAVIVSLLFVAAPLAVDKIEIATTLFPMLRYMAFVLMLAALASLYCYYQQNFSALFKNMTATIAAILLIFIANAAVINEKSIKPLALQLKQQLLPGDEVIAFYRYYHDLPIYLERRITIVADWHADDIAQNDNWVREMWYGMVFQDTKDWLIEDQAFWDKWNSNKRVYVITDKGRLKKLEAKTRVYRLNQVNDVWLLSNKPA